MFTVISKGNIYQNTQATKRPWSKHIIILIRLKYSTSDEANTILYQFLKI